MQNTNSLIVGLCAAEGTRVGAGSCSNEQNVVGLCQGYAALLEAMLFIMADTYLP